jgi:hypothetical protein
VGAQDPHLIRFRALRERHCVDVALDVNITTRTSGTLLHWALGYRQIYLTLLIFVAVRRSSCFFLIKGTAAQAPQAQEALSTAKSSIGYSESKPLLQDLKEDLLA